MTVTVTLDDPANPSMSSASFSSAGSTHYHDVIDNVLNALRGALVAHGYADDWDAHDWPRRQDDA